MPAGKWTIFTILKIKFDDLLFEKSVVFGHKNTLVGYLVNFWGVDHKVRFLLLTFLG